MELVEMKNEMIPVNAGVDKEGKINNGPSAILASRRLIPTGYWKGGGLALLLDLLSAILAGGLATHEISKQSVEYGLSQVFIAIDLSKFNNYSVIVATIDGIINHYHQFIPAEGSQ